MPPEIPKNIPTLLPTGVSTSAVTYHFRVQEPARMHSGGWALCTVNDETGELSIQSDWGSWAFRWNTDPRSLGETSLTRFIARRDPYSAHYLADKLCKRDEARSFDAQATVKAFRTMLAERRLKHGRDLYRPFITAAQARAIWDDMDELEELDGHEQLFLERFMNIDGHQLISEEPWEELKYAPTSNYQVLLWGILPALVEACFARAFPGRHRCELTMPREAGAGHWRDWHRGHNCHLDPTEMATTEPPHAQHA